MLTKKQSFRTSASEFKRVHTTVSLHSPTGCLAWFIVSLLCMTFAQGSLPAAPAPTAQANAPKWMNPPNFIYSSKGKPDPFHPIIQTTPPEPSPAEKPKKMLTPLERVQPGQLKLVGILSQKKIGERQALVELPNGKGYILQVGDPIGQRQGKVTAITGKSVVIQETSKDLFGKKVIQDTILKLHQQGESNG